MPNSFNLEAGSSSTQPEPMEVDAGVGQLMDDPATLQQLVEELPDESTERKKNQAKVIH